MADVDGRDALEMVLDRMEDKAATAARLERERDDARRELVDAQRRIQVLERDMANLRAAIPSPVPMVPRSGGSDPSIPF